MKRHHVLLLVGLALMGYAIAALVKSRHDRPCYVDTIAEVLVCP